MEVTYELENADYVDSSALAARQKPLMFALDVLVMTCLVVAGLLCLVFKYFLFGVLLPVLAWCYMMKRIYGWQTWRLPKELAHEKDIITLRLSEEGVECLGIEFHLQTKWHSFSHFIEDEYRFLLIFRAQKIFLTIPKRAFADEQQVNEARLYLGKIYTVPPASPTAKPDLPPIAKPY